MQLLDKDTIRNLLDLKSNALISEGIAERQLEVIRRGFNYLLQKDNNVLYIADEVGLGKTYIALGIAALLRHFTDHPNNYQDVIVVPKENLQYKWEKEIKQFISNNYKLRDNRVKSTIGAPVGMPFKKEALEPIQHDYPAYHIYRNSVFSMGLSLTVENKKAVFEKLVSRLTEAKPKELLQRAWELGYFNVREKSHLKKLYAYLLSLCNPEIELLIVDEGHNYKYGLGMEHGDEVSDRNNVAARFFGIKKNSEEDKNIWLDFPELARLVKPKVQKLIILSATPKTESLLELKRQMDCFLPTHLLSAVKKEEEIKLLLPQFLIRGNMEYHIDGHFYTRNLCRLEHRKGNVVKSLTAPPLTLKDNEQAIILGLLQYNTIKHLGTKNNGSFELGMLAGFETFRLDQEKAAKTKDNGDATSGEYEEVRVNKVRTSQDYSILKTLIESYKNRFGTLPPHPKQDAIVEASFQLMLQGEKALIFVRRVASANEMERRLLDKWEEVIAGELEEVWLKRYPSTALNQLLKTHKQYKENRELAEGLESLLDKLIDRFWTVGRGNYNFDFIEGFVYNEEGCKKKLQAGLYFLYNNYSDLDNGEQWYAELVRHIELTIVKTDFLTLTYQLLEQNFARWKSTVYEEELQEAEAVEEPYFFHSYFSKAHIKAFKQRLYYTDWFEVNYYLLNKHFKIANYSAESLAVDKVKEQAKDSSNIKEVQEIFLKYIKEEEYSEHMYMGEAQLPALLQNTLLTQLLIEVCEQELRGFLQQLEGKRKVDVFTELRTLVTIIRACLRNGAGFLPLFVADKAEGKDLIQTYISIIKETGSVFAAIAREVKTIISDYLLLRAVNFPEGESHRQIEFKLRFQSPIVGLSGQSTRNKNNIASQFRMPGFPYVLITTDIFREGEDLHTYCQNIYHYGIAWNCSDMEQRTGRIDRINSASHRKMLGSGQVNFEEKIHVFYPYVQNTLEVNQVNRLFTSINSFVETFNDFSVNVVQDGVASTGDVVEQLAEIPAVPLHSKYEYNYFKGSAEEGALLSIQESIGMQKEQLEALLVQLNLALCKNFSFHYGPEVDIDTFSIRGDIKITSRDGRRGPFVVKIINDIVAGNFILEVSSHLYKMSTQVLRLTKELAAAHEARFTLGNIDDFYALQFLLNASAFTEQEFVEKLRDLTEVVDIMEFEVSKGKEDAIVFQ